VWVLPSLVQVVLGGVEHGLRAWLDDLVLGEFERKDLVEGIFER
jgi:hypothetical protein